jgi:adenylate kinase family enzyme
VLRAKDNPFAVDRIRQIRYEPVAESWQSLLARLAAMDYRGAIVGPCGSGKTTMCEDLEIRLQKQGLRTQHLFLSMDIHMTWREIRRVLACPFDVIMVDGADHMSWLTWRTLKRRVFREKCGLVVTTHQPGLLDTWYECQTSPVLLERIVARLVRDQVIARERIQESYDRCQGNIRQALRELYDLVGYLQ